MKKILYFDLIGGAAGDMLLASLLELGASLDSVRAAWDTVGLSHVQLESKQVKPAGISARQVDVLIDGLLADTDESSQSAHHHAHRPYREIKSLLQNAPLDAKTKAIALDAFLHLAEAESKAHGVDIDTVEFHEVGSDDAIADIVGTAAAITALELDEIIVSPVPLARGLTKGAHGPIPLPAPATLFILKGVPVIETQLKGEMVTPTGAALLRALATRFGPIPTMTLREIGLGAGHKLWPDRPNIIRAMLGELEKSQSWSSDDDLILETNIDDMTAEQLAVLETELRALGALDVWSTSIHMKKGRMGQMVSALVRRSTSDMVARGFFTHSTTLGLREVSVRRLRTERHVHTVSTDFGKVQVKMAARADGSSLCMPEHEDCARLAKTAGVSLRRVYEAAVAAQAALHPPA
jgi:pyridinium-3,5-bisthiocarboxylic acid mononucleotide nickel chelatase